MAVRKFDKIFTLSELQQKDSAAPNGAAVLILSPSTFAVLGWLSEIVNWPTFFDDDITTTQREGDKLISRIYTQMGLTYDIDTYLSRLADASEAALLKYDELSDDLDCICQAVNNIPAPVGNATYVSGINDIPEDTTVDIGNGTPPPAMGTTWAEYDQALCDNANGLFDRLVKAVSYIENEASAIWTDSLDNLANFVAFGALAGLVLPPADFLIYLSAELAEGLQTALVGTTTTLQANKDDYICDIVTSSGVAQGKQRWADRHDALFSVQQATFLKLIVLNDLWNGAYTGTYSYSSGPVATVENSDCSVCTPPVLPSNIFVQAGSVVSDNGNNEYTFQTQFLLDSQPCLSSSAGTDMYVLAVEIDGTQTEPLTCWSGSYGAGMTIEIIAQSVSDADNNQANVLTYTLGQNSSGSTTYQSDTLPSGQRTGVRRIWFRCKLDTQFTIRFT